MPFALKKIALIAALLGTSATAALSLGLSPRVNQCIVEPDPLCFEPLLAELSERIASLEDGRVFDGYAPIPAAILLKARLPERAEEMSGNITEPDKRRELLTYVGGAYAHNGQFEDALRVLGELEAPQDRAQLIVEIATFSLRDAEVEPTMAPLIDLMDPELVDLVFAEIAGGLIGEGRLQKAGKIATYIFDSDLHAHAIARLSREYARRDDVANALSQLKLLRAPNSAVLARGEVGITLHERGHTAQAKQIFDDTAAMVMKRPADDPTRQDDLQTIAFYLMSSAYFDEALTVIQQVTKPEFRANLHFRLGAHLADTGQITTAVEHLEAAVAVAVSGGERYAQYGTLREIAVTLAEIGKVELATSVAHQIDVSNIAGGTIKSIGDVVLCKGDIAGAERLYASIEHPDLRATGLIEFSAYLAESGNLQKAAIILQEVEAALAKSPIDPNELQDGNYLRGSSIAGLSRAYANQADLNSALRVARTLKDTNQRLWTLIPIYGSAVEAHDARMADELLDLMFTELQAHPKPGDVLSLMSYLSTHPSNIENIAVHKKFAALLKDDQSKSLLFNGIFEMLTMNEKYVLADQVHALIPDQTFRNVAIIELLKRRIGRITDNR